MMTSMQKSASKAQAVKRVLKNPAFQGAVLAAPMTYAEYQGFNPFLEDLKNRDPTPVQKGTAYLMNTIGLASLLNPNRRVPAGLATMATMTTTPLMHAGGAGIRGMEQSVDRVDNLTRVEANRQQLMRRLGIGGLALGGATALGGLALARRAVRNAEKPKPTGDTGRVRVTLPTLDPDDVETHLDLPLDHPLLTQTNVRKFRRDLRQRLRDESAERRMLRSQSRAGNQEDDMEKAADILAFSRSLSKRAKFPQGPDSLMRPPAEGQPVQQGPDPAAMKQQQAMQGQMQQLQQENAQLQQQLQQIDAQVQQQTAQAQQEAQAVVQQSQMEAQEQVQKLQQQNAHMQQELNAQKQEAQLAKHEAQIASRFAELKAQERELTSKTKGKSNLSPALLNQAKLLNSHIGRLSKGASELKKKVENPPAKRANMVPVRGTVGPAPYAGGAGRAAASGAARQGVRGALGRAAVPGLYALDGVMQFGELRNEGRNVAQAGTAATARTAAGAGGWVAGKALGAKGALVGTAIGGPVGTAVGGALGFLGGMAGSMLAHRGATALTNTRMFGGGNSNQQREQQARATLPQGAQQRQQQQHANTLFGAGSPAGVSMQAQNRWGAAHGATTSATVPTSNYGGDGLGGFVGTLALPLISRMMTGPAQPSFPQQTQPRVHRGAPPGGYQ